MSAAFSFAPASERTLDAGAYLLGVLALALIVAPLAFAAWRLRGTLLPGWSGAPARVAEAVLGLAALILLAEALGTFAAFEAWTMIVGSVAIAAAAHVIAARRSPLESGPLPAPEVVAARGLARRRSGRRGRRGVDGPDPRQPRRRHGPGRLALVPHAPRDPVRTRRPLRLDRLLRPDLLRLVLSGELRGRARGAAARLRPRHPLAAAQPRLARPGAHGRLLDRPPLRPRTAVADRRRDRPRRPEPGRVPGRGGAQRHRRRLADPRGRRDSRERRGCARGRGRSESPVGQSPLRCG